jgi:hypothetical protein
VYVEPSLHPWDETDLIMHFYIPTVNRLRRIPFTIVSKKYLGVNLTKDMKTSTRKKINY